MDKLFPGLNKVNDLDFKNTLMTVCTIIAGVLQPLYCPSVYGYHYYYFYPKDLDGMYMYYLSTVRSGGKGGCSSHCGGA